jgi:hypothetical protein
MGCALPVIIALMVSQAIATVGIAGERKTLRDGSVALNATKKLPPSATRNSRATATTSLDRVATAVDGAESSYGKDMAMWRSDPSGPQGPMQVSEAAATDVGGGDRFDLTQNRALGRAYLAQLYGRYRNWPDAIAAYNWGIGRMDAWVKAGRPADKFLNGVAVYLSRVLHESGLCDGAETPRIRQLSGQILPASRYSSEVIIRRDQRLVAADPVDVPPDVLVRAACTASNGWVGGRGVASNPFYKRLDQAMKLALQHIPTSEHLTRAPEDRPAVPWNMAMRRP